MNASPPSPQPEPSTVRPRVDRIRDAALERFAANGTASTSLRDIADTAGVSVGLVQHHFGTKDRLITAVDKHVLGILSANLAGTASPADPVGDFGRKVTRLIAEHTDVMDYIVRALQEETPTGNLIFDALAAMGKSRWDEQNELLAPDSDPTWAALNPLLLVLGALTLRTHLNRHLPEPFTTTTQLARWETSVNNLIRRGQLRATPPTN